VPSHTLTKAARRGDHKKLTSRRGRTAGRKLSGSKGDRSEARDEETTSTQSRCCLTRARGKVDAGKAGTSQCNEEMADDVRETTRDPERRRGSGRVERARDGADSPVQFARDI